MDRGPCIPILLFFHPHFHEHFCACRRRNHGSPADKLQTIHRLYNLSQTTARAVSIHIYSRPIDSCVAFDMEKNQCYRRELAYFSKYGELMPKPEVATAAPMLTQLSRG